MWSRLAALAAPRSLRLFRFDRGPDCVLDVFLYGEGGSYRVVRSETRDRHVLPPQVAACGAGFDRRPPESRL